MTKMIDRPTVMAGAFERIRVKPQHQKTHGRLLMVAGLALANNVGRVKEPEWNAHLSFKTYNKLKDNGVMA
jgi:hypothetical protein